MDIKKYLSYLWDEINFSFMPLATNQDDRSSLFSGDPDKLMNYKVTRRGVYLSVLVSFLVLLFLINTQIARYGIEVDILIAWIIFTGFFIFPFTLFILSLIERKFKESGAIVAIICTINFLLYILGEELAKLGYNRTVLVGSIILVIISWLFYLWEKRTKSEESL